MAELTNEEIETHIQHIETMSHTSMMDLWRFAPAGHPIFDRRYPLYDIFRKRFDTFGGFTPTVSKEVGWNK